MFKCIHEDSCAIDYPDMISGYIKHVALQEKFNKRYQEIVAAGKKARKAGDMETLNKMMTKFREAKDFAMKNGLAIADC